MKRIFILIAMLTCGVALFAQDAEYNLIRRQYTLNDDGTLDIRYRKEIKLLRNRAITAYADKGETFILYNPAIDQLTINESYTIRKDGSKVQTPANAFIDQLPSNCENCGRYNGLRERVVVHTALEYDCIIVLDYTIHRRCAYLDEYIQLNQDCPVKRYEISINGGPLSVDESGRGMQQAQSPYKLWANNLSQTYVDSYLPPASKLYTTLHFTLGKKPDAAINNDSRLPEAANLVGELFDNDSLAYATAIRDYVVDYVRLNDIDASLLGYGISSACESFRSGCGTVADKNVLLAALLREAGMRATSDGNEVTVVINYKGKDYTFHPSPMNKERLTPEGYYSVVSTIANGQSEIQFYPITESNAPGQGTVNNAISTMPWAGVTIGGGYKQMTLPSSSNTICLDPARLTSKRTAPLQVKNGKEHNKYTISLPRTPKHHLVGKPVQINRTVKGVGSINISIRETENGSIEVDRSIEILVDGGIIYGSKQYKAFRKMMQEWNQYNTITIKAEAGRPRK